MSRSLSLVLLLFALAVPAQACPRQNENFFVQEYHGQENMGVGFIDTSNSMIQTSHVDFYIDAVQFNGTLLCGPVGRGTSCKAFVALRNGPLDPTDHVRILIRSRFENRFAYQFERSSAVRDWGSYCRPIWAKRVVTN